MVFKLKIMKKLLLILCLMVATKSFAGWHVIKGNGVAKTETREVSDFTILGSGGPIEVKISFGLSKTISVSGDENILPYIETYVKDNALNIKVKDGNTVKSETPIRVEVSMTVIDGLAQSGSGKINGKGDFKSDKATSFALSGSGVINLSFGKFSGLEINTSGSGKIELEGEIDSDINIAQSGSGSVDCSKVEAENVEAKISGSGNLKVNASKQINAHISGSGSIYYSGTASVESKVAGSGRIQKI